DMVYLGHTVKLMDMDDESEQLVKLVGEVQPAAGGDDVMPVSVNSPMGEALMKARVGDTVKVKAPRGTMEFKILEIVGAGAGGDAGGDSRENELIQKADYFRNPAALVNQLSAGAAWPDRKRRGWYG